MSLNLSTKILSGIQSGWPEYGSTVIINIAYPKLHENVIQFYGTPKS